MNLIIFLILRIISNPIANVFQKKLAAYNSSLVINFYTYLILSIFSLPLFIKYLNFSYGIDFFGSVILAGFLCALGSVCLIKAVSIGELSVLGPVNSYKSIIGLISSVFILKEMPSFFGILGIVFIIYGSRYIFNSAKEGFTFELLKRRDIQLRLSALLLTGIEAAILKKIIILSSVEECFIYWCFSGLFWSFVFITISGKKPERFSFDVCRQILLISLLLGIMQYSTNYVFNKMNVGYALALFQLSSLVTVLLGCSVFNEKNIKNKIIGSLIMIIGACLIILH